MRYLKYSITKMIYLDCVHYFEILDERVCHTLYTDHIGPTEIKYFYLY